MYPQCAVDGCDGPPVVRYLCREHWLMLEPCLAPLWRAGVARDEILNWLNAVNRRDWSKRPDKVLYWMKRYHHRANKIAQAHTHMVECARTSTNKE